MSSLQILDIKTENKLIYVVKNIILRNKFNYKYYNNNDYIFYIPDYDCLSSNEYFISIYKIHNDSLFEVGKCFINLNLFIIEKYYKTNLNFNKSVFDDNDYIIVVYNHNEYITKKTTYPLYRYTGFGEVINYIISYSLKYITYYETFGLLIIQSSKLEKTLKYKNLPFELWNFIYEEYFTN